MIQIYVPKRYSSVDIFLISKNSLNLFDTLYIKCTYDVHIIYTIYSYHILLYNVNHNVN